MPGVDGVIPPRNAGLDNFATSARDLVRELASTQRFMETRLNRVARGYSVAEISELFGVHRNPIFTTLARPYAPTGRLHGRERHFSIPDVMRLHAMGGAPRRRQKCHWRRPGDRLPVIVTGALKGGTGKTAISALIAQHAALTYGLRVGVIDADGQATLTLYFADSTLNFGNAETQDVTQFIGLPEPDPGARIIHRTGSELDSFWKPTPWPGIRLIPAGTSLFTSDITIAFLTRNGHQDDKHFYRLLRDAIARWDAANPPTMSYRDCFDRNGQWMEDAYQAALVESLDLIVIDTAPSMTMTQLVMVLAADTLVVTQTMKGFDLSTLRIYIEGLSDYLRVLALEGRPIDFPAMPSYILPTIVSPNSGTDMNHVGELYRAAPDLVCPVCFMRSDAVANAAMLYQSIYEYNPPKSRRDSAKAHRTNAYAVAEAVLTRAIPSLPARGFANEFIKVVYEGYIPPWNADVPPRRAQGCDEPDDDPLENDHDTDGSGDGPIDTPTPADLEDAS